MKKIYILLFMTFCTLCASAQPSAYYNFPDGAFALGLDEKCVLQVPQIYAPYIDGQLTFVSATGDGDWYTNGTKRNKDGVTNSTTLSLGLSSPFYIPVLKQEGFTDYSYGSKSTSTSKYVYAGGSTAQYLTPAKFWCDEVQATTGQALTLVAYYDTRKYDKMGVYFNNTDIMYIDKFSIPITFGTSTDSKEKTIDDLFPNVNSHIVMNVYPATITKNSDDSYIKSADRENPILSNIVLTKENFSKYVNGSTTYEYRGGITYTLPTPISINGAFLVELSDMNKTGCQFYVYSSKCPKDNFSLYYSGSTEKEGGVYTLGLSVHAMFPALYKDDASVETIQVAETGEDKQITIHSNVNPAASDFEINGLPDWASVKEITYEGESFSASKKSYVTFTVEANTGAPRMATITLNNRGKEITYTINQKGYSSAVVSSVGWGTVCVPFNLTVSDSYKVYKVTSDGTSITKQLVEKNGENKVVIPINTPVLVSGPALNHKSSTARYCSTDIDITEDNSMVGVFQDGFVPYDEEGEYEYYVLQNLDSGLGFYRVNSSDFAIKANRAYLKVPKASAAKDFLSFDETPTGINEVNNVAPVNNDKVYNMQGVSVDKNYKGIVISNGKKYIRK